MFISLKLWCTENDIKANPEQFWSFSFDKQSLNEDPRIRKAVTLKAAGHTHASIAEALDVSLSTVKRYTRTGGGS
ncbi:helix-turn-helix domain-containing protein [Rhizobium sp. CG5]|uniref:helix-turn-helix domain-containing protein n=1 Tax=Rhizobium sp. CG5 TaxID=2726076 RepID=UPI00332E779E|nr:helix-turn-helix domain-containing protein [Rhizobium sp. CG5]